ncbi:MAG TPA: spore coat U domain-containing protein [Gammaproteobacteria bacterium]|nr:spore coat U domain-containing protein [Gammaproteobacteria bacterium]
MFKHLRTLMLTGAAGLLVMGSAFAGPSPQTTTILVSANVIKSCNVSATALAFGTYDPLSGTNTTGTSTVNVQCTKTTVATMELNGGVNGTLAQRQMKDTGSSTDLLNYQLYTTSGNTAVWGDGTGGTSTQSYTSTSAATVQPFTVYGTIPSGQNVTPSSVANSYQDTITVTVTF